jgi:excinuclease ABC subunit A
MTVAQAGVFFQDQSKISRPLAILGEAGLGYLALGQPTGTLSGGEGQRLRLAAELTTPPRGETLYLFDEPTTGLHPEDVAGLLRVLGKLVDRGHSVVVIEHHLDVIKSADAVIDLGPAGGSRGGRLVAQGTPETVALTAESVTGQVLVAVLGRG